MCNLKSIETKFWNHYYTYDFYKRRGYRYTSYHFYILMKKSQLGYNLYEGRIILAKEFPSNQIRKMIPTLSVSFPLANFIHSLSNFLNGRVDEISG